MEDFKEEPVCMFNKSSKQQVGKGQDSKTALESPFLKVRDLKRNS